jgi:hypothetical protein
MRSEEDIRQMRKQSAELERIEALNVACNMLYCSETESLRALVKFALAHSKTESYDEVLK